MGLVPGARRTVRWADQPAPLGTIAELHLSEIPALVRATGAEDPAEVASSSNSISIRHFTKLDIQGWR